MIILSMDRRLRLTSRRLNRVVYTLTPSAARRIVFRIMRQTPRIALLAIASAAVVQSADIMSPKFLTLAQDLMHLFGASLRYGDISGAAYDGINVLIAVCGGIGVLLLGAAGGVGLTLVCGMKVSAMKTLQYLMWSSLACAAITVILTPLSLVAQHAVEAQMAQTVAEGKVFFLTTQLRARTAARILADEESGRWWATPEDGPSALAIKAVLRTGTTFGKSSITGELKDMADPKLRHSSRPIE